MTDSVLLKSTLSIIEFLLHRLWLLLQLCEELRIKDVQTLLLRLWNDIVLEKAEIEEDQDVIEVHTRFQELEVLFGHFYCAIEMSIHQLTDHFVILKAVNFGAMVVDGFVVVDETLNVGGKRDCWLLLLSVLF